MQFQACYNSAFYDGMVNNCLVNYQPLKWLAFVTGLYVYHRAVACLIYRSWKASIFFEYIRTACNGRFTTAHADSHCSFEPELMWSEQFSRWNVVGHWFCLNSSIHPSPERRSVEWP